MINLFVSFFMLFGSVGADVLTPDVSVANADILAAIPEFNKEDCTCKGIPLKGRVEVVTAGADFRIEVATVGSDLKVEVKTVGANNCGEWEFVTAGADFKVEFVTVGADFKVEFVTIAPGIR